MKKIILLIMMLTACATTTIPAIPEPEPTPMPVEETMYAGLWPNKEYTTALVKALDLYGTNLLKTTPRDADEWCFNKYKNKKQFYVTLISAMSKYESGWKPNTEYRESFKDQKGNYVVSVGLLQVSSESCQGYGMSYLVNSELKKNENNLECTVRVLNRWIIRDGVIAQEKLGGGRYWSVLRTGSTHKREQIKALVCK